MELYVRAFNRAQDTRSLSPSVIHSNMQGFYIYTKSSVNDFNRARLKNGAIQLLQITQTPKLCYVSILKVSLDNIGSTQHYCEVLHIPQWSGKHFPIFLYFQSDHDHYDEQVIFWRVSVRDVDFIIPIIFTDFEKSMLQSVPFHALDCCFESRADILPSCQFL